MAYARARGSFFCEICGISLYLVSTKHAECTLCKSRKNAKEILSKEISYRITTQDIKRELGIKQFDEETETGKSGARMIEKACDKCGNPEPEYTTRQMRSAHEGQTVFYHCPVVIIKARKLSLRVDLSDIGCVDHRTTCYNVYLLIDSLCISHLFTS